MYSIVDLSVFSKFASGGIVRGGELNYPTSCKWHVITKYDICDSQALILVEYSENFSARADAPIGNSLSIAFERVWGGGPTQNAIIFIHVSRIMYSTVNVFFQ